MYKFGAHDHLHSIKVTEKGSGGDGGGGGGGGGVFINSSQPKLHINNIFPLAPKIHAAYS